MYNSAPAISLDLTEVRKEEEMEGRERGRVVHCTRELDVRHENTQERDGEKPSDGQTESIAHWLRCCLMSVGEDEARKPASGRLWGNGTRRVENWHQKKTGSGVTQNKLDGPRSGKLCKTLKPTKRWGKKEERERQTKPLWTWRRSTTLNLEMGYFMMNGRDNEQDDQ